MGFLRGVLAALVVSLLCTTFSTATAFASVPDVRIRFETVDSSGQVISQISVGAEFLLNVYVQDGNVGMGIFSAYFDVHYPDSLVTPVGSLIHGEEYNARTAGEFRSGLIDEAGGRDTDFRSPTDPGREILLFSARFRAAAEGTVGFTTSAATEIGHDILVFGLNDEVDYEDVNLTLPGLLEIVEAQQPQWINPSNRYDVNNDSRVNPLDGLFILDELVKNGARQLPALAAGESPTAYYDVSGDGQITTLDVLWIFDYLLQ